MPADDQGRGSGGQTARMLFWCGIALAPLAAILLLVSDGAMLLRAAVVLVLLTVVLIGMSTMMRKSSGAVSSEVEDMIFDEIDALREDIRKDISHAAKSTHKTLSDKVSVVSERVDELRGQVNVIRDQAARNSGGPEPAAQPASPPAAAARPNQGGVLRHTETVHVTTRKTTVVDQNEESGSQGTVYGRSPDTRRSSDSSDSPDDAGDSDDRRRSERAGHRRASYDGDERREHSGGGHRSASREDAEPHDYWAGPPRQRRPDRSEGEPRALPSRPSTPTWSEELRGDQRDDREQVVEEASVGRRSRHSDDPLGMGPNVTGARSGGRWASIHADERGRELRMGERSSEVRSSGTGSEYRVEDRWASVRQDKPGGRRRREERVHEDELGDWSDSGQDWETTMRGGYQGDEDDDDRSRRGQGHRWDGDSDTDHDRDRGWDRDSDRDRSWDRDRDYERSRGGRSRARDHGHDYQDRDRDPGWDRARDRGNSRGRDRDDRDSGWGSDRW